MIVPILPTVLIESLELPQPILVGITTRDYVLNVMSTLSFSECMSKTWVILDPSHSFSSDSSIIDLYGAQVIWGENDVEVCKLSSWCADLIQSCQVDFNKFAGTSGVKG